MALGHKTGGRKKGSANKITTVQRAQIQEFINRNWPNVQAMLDDVWHGIEIEKTMPDGTTVVGRLNADPKGALEIVHKFMRFCVADLGRLEVTGADGGALQVHIVDPGAKAK